MVIGVSLNCKAKKLLHTQNKVFPVLIINSFTMQGIGLRAPAGVSRDWLSDQPLMVCHRVRESTEQEKKKKKKKEEGEEEGKEIPFQ